MLPRARRMRGHLPIQLKPGVPRFTLCMRMSVCAALLAFAGMLMANAAGGQSSASWYYCDLAHAYYPYVRTCPAPWRAVAPYSYGPVQPHAVAPPVAQPAAPAWVAPAPTAAAPPESQPSAAFRQGQVDRQAWETWFGTLTGDYGAGAEYWAGQRSLPHPGSCNAAPPSTSADRTAGCFAAQQKLAASDVRRKTEPEYRLGWNNPAPVSVSPPLTNAGATPTVQAPVRPPNEMGDTLSTAPSVGPPAQPLFRALPPDQSPNATPSPAPAPTQTAGDQRCNAPPYGGTVEEYKAFVASFPAFLSPTKVLRGVCNAKYGGDRTGLYNLGFTDEDIDSQDTEDLAAAVIVALKQLADKVK